MIYQMVHYDPATGDIKQAASTNVFFDLEGFTVGELADGVQAATVVYGKWMVDLATIVDRSADGLPPLVKLKAKTMH